MLAHAEMMFLTCVDTENVELKVTPTHFNSDTLSIPGIGGGRAIALLHRGATNMISLDS